VTTEGNVYHYSHVPFADEPKMRLFEKRIILIVDKNKGKRSGIWADYAVTSTKRGALPLAKSVSLEQGAMSMINPLTATSFLETAKKGEHKTIVLTAAASALGQMVNRLCRSVGVRVINDVRRDAQVALLKEQGVTIVLNNSEDDFDHKLHEACHQLDASLGFDAVAGPMTRQLLDALPEHSRVTVYSCLSHEAPRVGPYHLIFEDKAVNVFWLGPWINNMNLLQILMMWRRAQKLMAAELKSEIRAQYPFQEAKKLSRTI
jgi:NADPH:quinone reductase-like Zn-dependent oxidoreductase